MTDDAQRKPFTRRASFDQPELVGARWWRQGLRLAHPAPTQSRNVAQVAAVAGVVLLVGVIVAAVVDEQNASERAVPAGHELSLQPTGFDETTVTKDALDAQRENGWHVGTGEVALDYPDACDVDATGSRGPLDADEDLARQLAPRQTRLAPWYVSTLFQSPQLPANADLRAGLRPVFTEEMAAAFGRGEAVASLFESVGSPTDVAVIVDLPGPESVAFAAGLAPRFDPVFQFDNWPHPKGVVPSHLTLAAATYYRCLLARRRGEGETPPAFVLDRNRLLPYVDDARRFDNRYLAKLPSAASLKDLGVRHVLYVIPAGVELRELDDLNADFVALWNAGIDVKALPLSDLSPLLGASTAAARPGLSNRRFYVYGGVPWGRPWFWRSYGWYASSSTAGVPAPDGVSSGYAYEPTPRATIFSADPAVAAAARPRGFGSVTFHETTGRSGSYGRGSTSFSG